MSGSNSSDPDITCTFEVAGEMRERRGMFGHILVKVSKREDETLMFTSYWPEFSLVANIALL